MLQQINSEIDYTKSIDVDLSFSFFVGGGPSTPEIIEDGNTVGWYLSDQSSTITKDGSDRVSVWADYLGSGHDLLQATGADQGLWSANGILFDGVSEFIQANAFTYNQPEQIYIVFRLVTWINNAYVFDGNTSPTGMMQHINASPELRVYAGAASPSQAFLTVGNFGIIRVLFNGASSSYQINEEAEWTGNLGSSNMSGFTLGAKGAGGSSFANVEVKEVILRSIADTAPNNQIIYDYLANKYSI